MAVQKLGQSTPDTTQDEFQPHCTTSHATTQKQTNKQQLGYGKWRGGGGTVWTVTPPMNGYIEISVRKISLPTHKLEQEFENIWKKKNLDYHEQCLGMETL